jgi:hypothetical protein
MKRPTHLHNALRERPGQSENACTQRRVAADRRHISRSAAVRVSWDLCTRPSPSTPTQKARKKPYCTVE